MCVNDNLLVSYTLVCKNGGTKTKILGSLADAVAAAIGIKVLNKTSGTEWLNEHDLYRYGKEVYDKLKNGEKVDLLPGVFIKRGSYSENVYCSDFTQWDKSPFVKYPDRR